MLVRLARRLLLLVAVLGLMPGFDAAMEALVELADHGHAAHSVPGEPDPLAEEHGCTPVEHHCPCHAAEPVLLGRAGQLAARPPEGLALHLDPRPPRRAPARRAPLGPDARRLTRATAPPTPPPNA